MVVITMHASTTMCMRMTANRCVAVVRLCLHMSDMRTACTHTYILTILCCLSLFCVDSYSLHSYEYVHMRSLTHLILVLSIFYYGRVSVTATHTRPPHVAYTYIHVWKHHQLHSTLHDLSPDYSFSTIHSFIHSIVSSSSPLSYPRPPPLSHTLTHHAYVPPFNSSQCVHSIHATLTLHLLSVLSQYFEIDFKIDLFQLFAVQQRKRMQSKFQIQYD